jgi:hypothetical protein
MRGLNVRIRYLLACTVLVACSAPEPGGAQASGFGDAGAEADAAIGDGEAADAAACVTQSGAGAVASLQSQSGTVTIPFQVAIDGQPTMAGGIGSIAIENSRGTITIGKETLPAVVYASPNELETNDPSFQGIAVDAMRWVIFWPYCTSGNLTWVDYETSDAPGLVRSAAQGTCTVSATPVSFPMTWDAEDVHLDNSEAARFRLTGTEVSYTGTAPGTAHFENRDWSFWPFAVVDCTTCPGGPGDAGWYELHSLIETGNCGTTCFGIYYLFVQPGNPVILGWLGCLPALAAPDGGNRVSFQATWSR